MNIQTIEHVQNGAGLVEAFRKFPRRWIAAAKSRMAERARYRRDRAAFQQMLLLEDDMLRDIGVTRADVEWANSLPIGLNASNELERVTREARLGSIAK